MRVRKDYEKLFTYLKPPEPPAGLFEKIITAINREKEISQTKRLLFVFCTLFIVSALAVPFSWQLLYEQAIQSGIIYFLSATAANLGIFASSWKEFIFAILESLPLAGIAAFCVNMAAVIFCIRLFFYKKSLLVTYLFGQHYKEA